jgi:phosphate transport system protein
MGVKQEKAFVQLQKDFDDYSNLVVKQLRLLESILDADAGATFENHFREIKAIEKEIDNFDLKISESVINLIVLYSPVATELRKLMAMNRASLNLEKIGDLVVNISRKIKKIEDQKLVVSFSEIIGDIYLITTGMVEKALCALNYNDMDYAIWTIKNDDMVDELHKSIIKKIIRQKLPHVETQAELKTFINLMNIAKDIERIADCATNIAEAAIYCTMGKDVRHKKIDIESLTLNLQKSPVKNIQTNNLPNGNKEDTGSGR